MRNRLIASALVLTLSSLASARSELPPPSCHQGQSLTYMNSSILDGSIESAIIAGCPQIRVSVTDAMTLESVSPRLERWMVLVFNNGGEVRVQPMEETTRDLSLTVLRNAATTAWDYYKAFRAKQQQSLLAEAASGYNVTVKINEQTAQIQAVEFTRRQ